MSTKKQKYDAEFKDNSVKLLLESGRSVRQISQELGVNEQTLHRWKSNYLSKNGNKKEATEMAEVAKLKKELERVKMERDILKKALGYFSREE